VRVLRGLETNTVQNNIGDWDPPGSTGQQGKALYGRKLGEFTDI
jgi:hypothetical protein